MHDYLLLYSLYCVSSCKIENFFQIETNGEGVFLSFILPNMLE